MKEKMIDPSIEIAMNVSKISLMVNFVLSAGKLITGIIANSGAMISDAIHSASDVFSTLIVMIGVTLAGKKSDKDHQYGHERLECVASIVLAVILCGTGLAIGWFGIEKIIAEFYLITNSTNNNAESLIQIPGRIALIAAVVSIITKEWMYLFTRKAAKKINSVALLADAWHHQSDALSSIGSFIGIFGARMGFPIMEPIASFVISIFIIKASFDIFKEAVNKMVDKACDEKTEKEIEKIIISQKGVIHIDSLLTRLFGAKIYVDVEITADGNKTLNETHAIAEAIHEAIEKNFPTVKHCMVHVNPDSETNHEWKLSQTKSQEIK